MSTFIDEMMKIIDPPPQAPRRTCKNTREPYRHDLNYYYIATHPNGREEIIEHLPSWCEERPFTTSQVSRVCSGHRTHVKGIRFKKVMREEDV